MRPLRPWLPLLVLLLAQAPARTDTFPHRIVSLSPAATEMLFAIGAGDRVVGVTDYCDEPPAARTRPKVGGVTANSISLEAIVGLRPDLVVAARGLSEALAPRLRRLGIAVEVVAVERIADVWWTMRHLGERLGLAAEAAAAIAARRARLRHYAAAVSRLVERRPRLFYQVWDDPLMTTGRRSFLGELLELAGAHNIFADLELGFTTVSPEEVVRRDPEVILIPDHHGAARTRLATLARPGWQRISAIRTGRVRIVDGDLVSRAGPRLPEALLELVEAIHGPALRQRVESSP